VLARTGDHTQAVREAQEAMDGKQPSSEVLYEAGLTHALAVAAVRRDMLLSPPERDRQAEEYAARAVELLQKAQEAGYFRERAAREELRNDPELEPLQGREDFRKLLA